MTISLGQIIVWLIIGALAGSLAGMVVRRSTSGFGRFGNLILGLIGAVIGGYLFDFFNINLGLGSLTITFEDLIAAFAGSLILLAIIGLLRRRRR
ncbi:MAG: GlsB/YeaQ/YmgE family stress response membrane protein [Chloroflexota bacterium]